MNTLAYLDTTDGLIPCKVLAIETMPWPNPYGLTHLRVRVTGGNGNLFKRGSETTYSDFRVVPRENVRRFRGNVYPSIVGTWDWAERLGKRD